LKTRGSTHQAYPVRADEDEHYYEEEADFFLLHDDEI